jgi:TPR repeat protein
MPTLWTPLPALGPDTSAASHGTGMAAAAGGREGQFRHGLTFLEGRGVVQDYRSALDWFQRAAEQNHPKAQRRLGQMYADGRGTPVDTIQADVWLSLATAPGEEHAARQRDQVLLHLGEDEIDKALEQARALHGRPDEPAPPGPAGAVPATVDASAKEPPAAP